MRKSDSHPQIRVLNAWLSLILLVITIFPSISFAEGPGPLEGRFFGSGSKTLVVTLHGDLSNGQDADYQFEIAKSIVSRTLNVIAFGMIRPGYSDKSGLTSPGNNFGRRDQYTRKNNSLVAETIKNLKIETGAQRVVAIGHSGGAIQIANVLARHPGVIDAAVLVSCPCDFRTWAREHGFDHTKMRSQNPMSVVNKVPVSAQVIAITGQKDVNTIPASARRYIERLQKNGVDAKFVEVRGSAHNYDARLADIAEHNAAELTRP